MQHGASRQARGAFESLQRRALRGPGQGARWCGCSAPVGACACASGPRRVAIRIAAPERRTRSSRALHAQAAPHFEEDVNAGSEGDEVLAAPLHVPGNTTVRGMGVVKGASAGGLAAARADAARTLGKDGFLAFAGRVQAAFQQVRQFRTSVPGGLMQPLEQRATLDSLQRVPAAGACVLSRPQVCGGELPPLAELLPECLGAAVAQHHGSVQAIRHARQSASICGAPSSSSPCSAARPAARPCAMLPAPSAHLSSLTRRQPLLLLRPAVPELPPHAHRRDVALPAARVSWRGVAWRGVVCRAPDAGRHPAAGAAAGGGICQHRPRAAALRASPATARPRRVSGTAGGAARARRGRPARRRGHRRRSGPGTREQCWRQRRRWQRGRCWQGRAGGAGGRQGLPDGHGGVCALDHVGAYRRVPGGLPRQHEVQGAGPLCLTQPTHSALCSWCAAPGP